MEHELWNAIASNDKSLQYVLHFCYSRMHVNCVKHWNSISINQPIIQMNGAVKYKPFSSLTCRDPFGTQYGWNKTVRFISPHLVISSFYRARQHIFYHLSCVLFNMWQNAQGKFERRQTSYKKHKIFVNYITQQICTNIPLTVPHPGTRALPFGRAPNWCRCTTMGVGFPKSHGVAPSSQHFSQRPEKMKTWCINILQQKPIKRNPKTYGTSIDWIPKLY